jgi:hypothetical protein
MYTVIPQNMRQHVPFPYESPHAWRQICIESASCIVRVTVPVSRSTGVNSITPLPYTVCIGKVEETVDRWILIV